MKILRRKNDVLQVYIYSSYEILTSWLLTVCIHEFFHLSWSRFEYLLERVRRKIYQSPPKLSCECHLTSCKQPKIWFFFAKWYLLLLTNALYKPLWDQHDFNIFVYIAKEKLPSTIGAGLGNFISRSNRRTENLKHGVLMGNVRVLIVIPHFLP